MYSLTTFVTALFAASVSAQFSGLPACAQNCTINAIPSSCNLNPTCICSDSGFINAITCCVAKVCDQADQEATIKYADSICVPAGVTNLPTTAVCKANSTGTATGVSTATGAANITVTSIKTSSTASSGTFTASTAGSSTGVASSSATSGAAVASSTGDASRAFYAQGLGMMGAAIGAAVALM